MIHSDEGLLLEISALKLFMVANIYVINSIDDTKLPPPLLQILYGQLLSKWEPFFLREKNKQNKNWSTLFSIIIINTFSFKEIVIVNLITSIALQYSTLLEFKVPI